MTKARDLASSTPVPSAVSTTELGYVDGVTSAIQTQVDSKLATATASSTYQTKAAAGLVLLNTTSFSGVSSVSLAADTFTSTYDIYKVVLNVPNPSSTPSPTVFRLRASGTDNSSNNYYWRGSEYASSITTYSGYNSGGATSSFRLVFGTANQILNSSIELFNPKLSNNTSYISTSPYYTGSETKSEIITGAMSVNTSYDSMTFIFPVSFTGTVNVYGYNK
jgi:hypothetical protein